MQPDLRGATGAPSSNGEEFIFRLERPLPRLLHLYIIRCLPFLLFPPVGIALLLVHYFRYSTMRYRFDSEGISMSWGILFRHETLLNYARIQDIHLVSGFVERWLGLARIQLQTASGSATPEMTLEGLPEHEQVRDFLYARMRGTRDNPSDRRSAALSPALPTVTSRPDHGGDAELASALREVTAELRGIREILSQRQQP
jgi:putative membrane protein